MNAERKMVYEKLYRIIKKNMELNGGEMPFEEQTFLTVLGTPRNIADIAALCENDSAAFLENAFLQLLNRFPDEGARKGWCSRLSESDVKRKIIRSIVNSPEFQMKESYLCNNLFEDEMTPRPLSPAKYRGKLQKLVPIARHLPPCVKKVLKRCLRMV